MKKTGNQIGLLLVSILAQIIISLPGFAQAPHKMSYQAVVRDAGNKLVIDKEVGIKINILKGSAEGTQVYEEVFAPNPTTNANGLVSLELGITSSPQGNFYEIDWMGGPYFIKVEIDPEGGTNYTVSGTSQLLSVPYALHASSAQNFNETDPLWKASPSFGITNTSLSNWNTAYNWGNHSSAGYVTSITETDPTWSGTANQTSAIGRTGSVGIGTTSPAALLHTNGTGTGGGNILFAGAFKTQAGDPPASGAGTRMMWYPDKAAFRAGEVTGSQWTKDNLGFWSAAFGRNTTASGSYSFAAGESSSASGVASTALGRSTIAVGMYSLATGQSTYASGDRSTAMGITTVATGHASLAVGMSATASGETAMAMGSATTASGFASTAMGTSCIASGIASTAMGSNARAHNNYSFAINLTSAQGPLVAANTFQISGAAQIGGNRAWTNHSDLRLKKDIVYLDQENSLEKIMKLRAVRYRWKEYNELLNLGFIAQEVESIVPEAVRYDQQNDIYNMEYTAIIPVLVEGMKEQQQMIISLQKMIEQQQQQIEALKGLVAK